MDLSDFLVGLADSGRVRVAEEEPAWETELRATPEVTALLEDLDASVRADFPGVAPPLSPRAALFGARALHRGARFLVYRHFEQEDVRSGLSADGARDEGADAVSVAYSVDLCLRHLAELHGLAAGVSRDDPLLLALEELGRAFPLSSIGVPGLGELAPGPALGHRGLLAVYVDRVLASGDWDRLQHEAVRAVARSFLGDHPELSPRAAEHLRGERR